MKTFKLCSLIVYLKEENTTTAHRIELVDGLIINKEDEDRQWLIEAILKKDQQSLVEKLGNQKQQVLTEVVITNNTNPPAFLQSSLRNSKHINDHIEILLNASIVINRDDFSEMALKDLIDQGFKDERLLDEFKKLRTNRGYAYQNMMNRNTNDKNGE